MTDYGIAAKQQQIMDSLTPDGSRVNYSKFKRSVPVENASNDVKQPSYMPGGVANASAPAMSSVMPQNYGMTSAPMVYDEGGKVNVGPDKDILSKAADYAKNLYFQARSLMSPEDNEAKSFQEKTKQVDDVLPSAAEKRPALVTPSYTSPVDLVAPAPYGSRAGEKRPEQILKPISENVSAPSQSSAYARVYDEGGEVDLDEDGKNDHQEALLSDGERVLSPEEAKKYEKEHPEVKDDGREGAPVDFGGRVFPQTNPPTIPVDSDNPPTDTDKLPVGVQPNVQNAPMSNPKGDISNPPTADIMPAMGQPIVARSETNGTEPQSYGAIKQPSYQPGKQPAEQAPDINKVLEQRKSEAAMKGDLMGLGAAIIGQKALGNTQPMPVYGGPQGGGGQEIPSGPPSRQTYQNKMAYYQKAYQDALDEFTPEGKERAAGIREAMLNYEKLHPYGSPESAQPGFLGKVKHTLADIGNVAGAAVGPEVERNIPQSLLGREKQQQEAEQLGIEGSKEAQEQAATEASKTETALKRMGVPTQLTGDENVRTNTSTGQRERAYKYIDGVTRWVPEGISPLDPSIYTPPKFDLFSSKTPQVGAAPPQVAPSTPTNVSEVTTQNNTAGTAAAAAATGQGAPQFVYGEKPDAEHQPASKAQIGTLDASIASMPALTEQQRSALAFPPNYTPTVADVKDRLGVLEKIQNSQRQANQDKFNDQLREVMAQNSQLLAQAHLEDEKLKHDQLYANNASTADSAQSALFSQQIYNEDVKRWQKSPSYAKDVVLVQNLINEAKNGGGSFSLGGAGDTTIGAMLGGPAGAAIGGAVGVVGNALKGPAEAGLETLKKQGISPEGYAAMQAYFNSIPGRLSFETSVMGVKATAMRMREVIRSLMNTVPSPNTPADSWDNAFNLYYKPMKNLTDRKIKNLDLPKDYSVPTRETLGYPSAPKERLPRPQGATHMGHSTVDNQDYYLDAQGKKLGPVYKQSE